MGWAAAARCRLERPVRYSVFRISGHIARSSAEPGTQWPEREARHISKGAKQAAEKNNRSERNQRTDHSRHDYVEIARFVSRPAYREQRDHRTVVRKTIERARADHSDTVHEPW